MGTRLFLRLAVLAIAIVAIVQPPVAAAAAVKFTASPASGGHGDMLFIGGAGIVMLVAVGALAAAQSRGQDATARHERGPDQGDDPWV
ncbi:hypothetical protein [Phytohabitans kaempferiae]|uniref:Gram-positive cocci surface proteins LPxTG domain-containing protein n=1 Tax=Phytohabitans kaempferiae TaxID=1620943 RepID=A0ABV6M4D1_9ACTN